MRSQLTLICISVVVIGLGKWAYHSLSPKVWNPLPMVTPQAAGLRWEECEFTKVAYEGNQTERHDCDQRFPSPLRDLTSNPIT